MKDKKDNPGNFAELRKQAEKYLAKNDTDLDELSSEDIKKLIHELRVHQIELEMQNDELRRIQQMLQDSRNMYSDLYDFAPVGYLTVGIEGMILEANLTSARMLGVERGLLIGKPMSRFIFRDDQDTYYLHRKLLFTEKTLRNCELRMLKNDGAQFYARLESSIKNDTKHCQTIFSDVTEQKKMEQELLKMQKLESIGILAGGIAHDLNNILMAVIGGISLAKSYKDPLDKDRILTEAETASIQIKDLTTQLLTFAKGGTPVMKTMSIVRLLRDSALFALRGSNVKCEFVIPDDLKPVNIDEGQINQVINNLIINAQQAMPNGGIIWLRCENINISSDSGLSLNPGEYVKITIQDEGIGIPEDHINKIFDPFFTTKQKGSGLGLTTSYSIIQKHNGYITVKSTQGAGTAFYIYLPASFAETPLIAQEEERAIEGKGRILFMDDEEPIRTLVSEMLNILGYATTTANDGDEAIELYQQAIDLDKPYNLVIMDLTVPGGMGGKDAIKELMKIDPTVKAIVSSGYSSYDILSNFRVHGFKDFIAKPYRLKQLSEVVNKVLKG